jgi:hypothetical protein
VNRALVVTWFVATFIAGVAVFLLLLMGDTVNELRRLRRAAASRPTLIVWKRLIGPVAKPEVTDARGRCATRRRQPGRREFRRRIAPRIG